MCGIAGYSGDFDAALLERMNEAIAHRGEDRVAVAQNMAVGVPPEVLPVLCQWISAGLDESEWGVLVARVPALTSSAG